MSLLVPKERKRESGFSRWGRRPRLPRGMQGLKPRLFWVLTARLKAVP